MKEILIIVPSYQRQNKILGFYEAWKKTTSNRSEVVLVLEEKDEEYPKINGVKIMKGNYGNIVISTNEAFYKYPDYKIYGFLNDDHILRTKGWEDVIIKTLENGGYAYGNDLLQKEKLATAVFISGDIVRKLGYICTPRLTHLYIDRTWNDIGNAIGKLYYLENIIIEHMHFTAGKSDKDEQYKRVNSDYGKWVKIYDDWKKTMPEVVKLKSRPKCMITGEKGFIGSALKRYLENANYEAIPVTVESLPNINADYFFHFGSPSSNILYNSNRNCIKNTIEDFIKIVEFCQNKHIKLIFPSSATVYENKNNYAHTKKSLEEIAQAYNLPFLALRIYAGYGIGEAHKKDYASVVYQWCRQAIEEKKITIYGDGSQSRDFVYIDNIIVTIVNNMNRLGIIDIGTGVNTTFNKIIELISKQLDKKLEIEYIPKPKQYLEGSVCKAPISSFIDIEEGIKKIIQSFYD